MLRHRLGKDPHQIQYWLDTYYPNQLNKLPTSNKKLLYLRKQREVRTTYLLTNKINHRKQNYKFHL